MKRFLFSTLTLTTLALFAITDSAIAQSKIMLSAEGISFSEEPAKSVQFSSIVYPTKKGITIGSPVFPSIEFGWNILSNVSYNPYKDMDVNKFMNIREWKSTQVTVNLIGIGVYNPNNKIGITAALGIRANNYRLDNNTTLTKVDGMVMPAAITDLYGNMARKKSKFNIASIHIPLEVQFGDPSKFAFSIGGYCDLVMNSHTKIKFDNGAKEKVHNFPTNFIQAGTIMRFTFRGFSLYCSYQPTQIFKTDCGPKAQQWSVGIGF